MFEPLSGWKPFENAEYGDGFSIIHHCIKNNDFSALFPGDYFYDYVGGTRCQFVVGSIDSWSGAYILSRTLVTIRTGKITSKYQNNSAPVFNSFLTTPICKLTNDLYDKLPSSAKSYIKPVDMTYTGPAGKDNATLKVFPPAANDITAYSVMGKYETYDYYAHEYGIYTNAASVYDYSYEGETFTRDIKYYKYDKSHINSDKVEDHMVLSPLQCTLYMHNKDLRPLDNGKVFMFESTYLSDSTDYKVMPCFFIK